MLSRSTLPRVKHPKQSYARAPSSGYTVSKLLSQCLMTSARPLLVARLNVSNVLPYCVLIFTTLCGTSFYYSHFTDEATEAETDWWSKSLKFMERVNSICRRCLPADCTSQHHLSLPVPLTLTNVVVTSPLRAFWGWGLLPLSLCPPITCIQWLMLGDFSVFPHPNQETPSPCTWRSQFLLDHLTVFCLIVVYKS